MIKWKIVIAGAVVAFAAGGFIAFDLDELARGLLVCSGLLVGWGLAPLLDAISEGRRIEFP